jgi:anti-sigma B factor antagonist
MTTVIERTGPRSFRLFGQVDAASAPDVADFLDGFFEDEGDMTLDLRDVEFLDSTGIGVLVLAAQRIPAPAKLIIESPQHAVRRAIELTGLLELPNIEVTDPEALPGEVTGIDEPP